MWYSYAIVRVVPRVERGEFLNVGIVLFSRELDFLDTRLALDAERMRSLAPWLDLTIVERHLETFAAIAEGNGQGGPIAALPKPERFHWLVAPRSTMIQTSPVHVGRGDSPERVLDELLSELVRLPQTAGADGA